MVGQTAIAARFGWGGMAAVLLTCCAGPAPRSTRLTAADLTDVVEKMRTSLAASDFLAARDSGSERVVIVINRVENLTSDVLSRAEQWMLVARVRAALPIQRLARQKNVALQIAPERHAMLKDAGFTGDLGPEDAPTHVLGATYRSARRAARGTATHMTDRRAEYYYFEYRITDLRRRDVVWTDSFEIKREAVGLAID